MGSTTQWKFALVFMLVLGIAWTVPATAQSQAAWQPGHGGIEFGQSHDKQWVQMVSSPEVAISRGSQVGQQNNVALRFAIDSGLHINSHNPHSTYLIPTTLTLTSPAGVAISKVDYPQGVDFHLAFDPKDALSVYTGEFGVLVQVHARPGRYTLHGQLRYQACDNRACNPPKTLPLTLDVTAR